MKLLSEARLSQRSGFTLTEVLMAMFVMAIGMISLLALFPVGFLNARWALDAEQVSRGAANAQAMTEMPRVRVTSQVAGPLIVTSVNNSAQSVRNDQLYKPEVSNNSLVWRITPSLAGLLGRRDFLIDMTNNTWTFNTNINYPPPPLPLPGLLPNARVRLPPVFVDPQVADMPAFKDTALTGLSFHVGADTPPSPFRMNGLVPQVVNTNAAYRPRWSLGIPRISSSQYQFDPDLTGIRKQTEISNGDEIDFGQNGQPNNNVIGNYARQRRFTWAYMCHWPDYANVDLCDVTVVVFNSRSDYPATLPVGETTYVGNPAAALAAGIETDNVGRVFRKGLSQAAVVVGTVPTPLPLKVNDWILDSTMILPEYNNTIAPAEQQRVPFLDEYHPNAYYEFTLPSGSTLQLRPGLVGGHFYKVLDISPVQSSGGVFYQTITLDRPARSDGFTATVMTGIADVITKSAGRLPQK